MHIEPIEVWPEVTELPEAVHRPPEFEITSTHEASEAGSGPNVVALVPAYNEEKFIGSVVLKALRFATTVVVVDDGSSDSTAVVAEAAGAIVVRHTQNMGKGVALNTGFLNARRLSPDVVVTLDADGQHEPHEIELVVAPVLSGESDIVVGSRYLRSMSDVPSSRVWGHAFFNVVTRGVSGVDISDSQSGFRAFSPRAVACLIFNSNRFSVESEMQLMAREHRLTVSEVPITIEYHAPPKRSVWMQGLSVLHGILKLTGQYRPLLFFGLPGIALLVVGLALGLWVIEIYRNGQVLPIGYAVLSALITTIAALTLYTGIILHSVRGLLMSIVRPPEDPTRLD